MSKLNAVLVLGCRGDTKNGFVFCPSIENIILDLSILDDDIYDKVENFLEYPAGLFESQVSDINKCSNILNLLYKTFKVINENTLYNIQKFILKHKECGLYLMLILKEDYYVR